MDAMLQPPTRGMEQEEREEEFSDRLINIGVFHPYLHAYYRSSNSYTVIIISNNANFIVVTIKERVMP